MSSAVAINFDVEKDLNVFSSQSYLIQLCTKSTCK